MQILLTNDDGIYAPGLAALERVLKELGDVCVVAPATEQSGVGHSITYLTPLTVKEVFDGDRHRGWAVEGSPADCVKLGVAEFSPRRPDLVVSGINYGLNAGINVLYSGTVAAAIEGAFYEITSVAVSLEYDEHADFDRAAHIAVGLIRRLAAQPRAGMERARAKILEALKALEPVQNAHSIAQEIEIDVQLGNFEAAQSKVELLRQQVLQFPNNVAIRLEFENAKQALEEGRASVDEFFAFTRDAVDALNNIAMDGLASALALPFDAILDDAEDFGARMENLVKDLVRSLIHEFAKLAALRIFRALLGGGALSTFSPEPGDSLSSRTPAPAPPTSKAAAQPEPTPQSVPSAVRVQAPRIVVGHDFVDVNLRRPRFS